MSESTHSTSDATSETMDSQEPLLDDNRATPTITTNPSTPRSGSSMSAERQRMRRGGPRCCAITGLVIAIVGAILAFTFPLLYHAILNHELSLQSGTLQYRMWTDAPIPIYIKFYFFNVTNSEDVIEFQAKPILEELGPYTFEEKHIRVNVQPYDNYTISFQQRRVWHFVPEMSNGSLDDNVTSLNVPLVGAAHLLRYQPLWFKVGFNRIVSLVKSKLFITKTAIELLFDGYDDPLLTLGQKLPSGMFPPFDKFAWFYQRNNSNFYDGVFNIFTGADQITKFGEMDMWNLTRQTNYYESHCGMVNGSFGEGFAPRRNRSNISLYLPDICRSLTLDYAGEVTNQDVSSFRFAGTDRVFANATDNPDNWCFCSGGVCNPSGVGNFSTCRFNMPIFVSYPHYYLADPYYADQVQGLAPEQELHEFHIDLEPEMAIPTSVRARLQINILVEPDIDIDPIENVERAFIPVIWFEISADVNQDLGWWINLALKVPVIGTASFFALFCLSLVGVTVSGIILIRRRSGVHTIASSAETAATRSSCSRRKEDGRNDTVEP